MRSRLDADKFKQINDTYGHLAGNTALQEIASLLVTSCRAEDFVVRDGGDEFILILPQTDASEAARVTQRIIAIIANSKMVLRPGDKEGVYIRVSYGVATFPQDGSTAKELHEVADSRLYATKLPAFQLPAIRDDQPHQELDIGP